jgi:S1-C subfamily serine protease
MDELRDPSTGSEAFERPLTVPAHFGPERVLRERAVPVRVAAGEAFGSGRMVAIALLVAAVLASPYVVGHFIYQIRFNEMKAGVDVATSTLASVKPRLNDLELASRLIAERVEPSVVSIFRPGSLGRDGQGSGVVVDAAGYIVTNYHVVNGAESIQVQLSDGRRVPASVVGADALTDMAVLKVDADNLIAADWGDSDELQVGDLVWALGSPYGLDHSLTFGIVSAKARRSGSRFTQSPYQEYLQTDAAVNPGNSGGPLVNIEGQIVGINAAIFGTSYQGISFAIPSALAHEKYDQLRTKGWIERAWLGIMPREVPDEVRDRLGLGLGDGVYVAGVQADGPADRAGIRAGDVILKWNDQPATDPTLLSRAIASTKIGSIAKVVLASRQGQAADAKKLEFSVKVERHPWSVRSVNGQ